MDFSLTSEQQAIRDSVHKICAAFDDDYWLERDRTGEFPSDFCQAIADGGWLGIAMPEEFGGAGLAKDAPDAVLLEAGWESPCQRHTVAQGWV